MKRIILLAALVFAAASVTFGQPPTSTPEKPTAQEKPVGEKMAATGSVEQAVRQLDRDLLDAMMRNDTALLEKVATDDYTITNPLGMVITKAQAIAGAKNFKFESLTPDDVQVRVYGDAAVVTGRATVKGQLKTPAATMQDISGQYRYTRVYVKQEGQWRLVAHQMTPIAQQPAQ